MTFAMLPFITPRFTVTFAMLTFQPLSIHMWRSAELESDNMHFWGQTSKLVLFAVKLCILTVFLLLYICVMFLGSSVY